MPTKTFDGVAYEISPAHPAAEAFPWLHDDDLRRLAAGIKADRQHYRIIKLPDGRVVDGRNRELACRIAGVEPLYTVEDMDAAEIVALVRARNLDRRHMTPSQAAMAAAILTALDGGTVTQAEAAAEAGVSERSVRSAAKVLRDAPELVPAVTEGDIDVATAAKAADLPARTRRRVAKAKDKKAAIESALSAPAEPDPFAAKGKVADPDDPPLDPALMPNAAEAGELAAGFRNLAARLRAVVADLDRAFPDRGHVVGRRIDAPAMAAGLREYAETLDRNRPEHACPACCGTGTDEGGAACKFCDGYGVIDAAHHAGLKGRWKQTRGRLAALEEAARQEDAA